jgi:glycosyltransferase involved in cell wall biosynthesis
MKVSIITVCYNSEKYIKTAIESVLSQDYDDIECIIVDGASTDNTKEIIKSFGDKISIFISETDKGIYDAMNKGIKLATGDIIGTLNSDDLYDNNQVISEVVDKLKNSSSEILYGNLYYVKKENTDSIVRTWQTDKFISGSFKKGWHPAHPTLFVKREVYTKFGLFNLDYHLAADFELMLRFLEKYKLSNIYLNKPMVKMRLGGATNKNLRNIFNQNIECYKAFKKNQLNVSVLYPVYRLVPKIFQYFRKYK